MATAKTKKEPVVHKDTLGRVLEVGNYVAYSDSNQLRIGIIEKLNPIMVKVKALSYTWSVNKYPQDTVKLDGPELTMYLLKR